MATYEEHVTQTIKIVGTCDDAYTEATYKRIVEDALFFLDESRKHNANRYARVSTLLMAFYLESLSHRLSEALPVDALTDMKSSKRHLRKKDKDKKYREGKVPDPIYTFRAVHYLFYQTDLPLNIDGIQDIFTIRDKVIAHPAGFSKEKHSEVAPGRWQRSREDRTFSYLKFKDFPFLYSQFTPSHAVTIVQEVKEFLTNFHNLLKGKVSEQKLLDACWPTELVEWSKRVGTK